MTYKPKRNPEIDTYKNNPEKFSSNGKNKLPESETEYFLKHGKTKDGAKREISKVVSWNKKYTKEDLKGYNFSDEDINKKFIQTEHGYTFYKKRFHREYDKSLDEAINKYEYKFINHKKILEKGLNKIGFKKTDLIDNTKICIMDEQKIACVAYTQSGIIKLPNGYINHNYFTGRRNSRIVIHELLHIINELGFINKKLIYTESFGYTSGHFIDSEGTNMSLLNEGFTDMISYFIIGKNNNTKNKFNESLKDKYYNYIIILSKLIDLASKKLNKSPEYIYNYMMRGYIIKGYKGLNLFYQAFGKNFIKGFMGLSTSESDKIKLIELIGNNYDKLGFENLESAMIYFDKKNPPSREIGNIIGIER